MFGLGFNGIDVGGGDPSALINPAGSLPLGSCHASASLMQCTATDDVSITLNAEGPFAHALPSDFLPACITTYFGQACTEVTTTIAELTCIEAIKGSACTSLTTSLADIECVNALKGRACTLIGSMVAAPECVNALQGQACTEVKSILSILTCGDEEDCFNCDPCEPPFVTLYS